VPVANRQEVASAGKMNIFPFKTLAAEVVKFINDDLNCEPYGFNACCWFMQADVKGQKSQGMPLKLRRGSHNIIMSGPPPRFGGNTIEEVVRYRFFDRV
jgi:predicted ATPase with chaperone activity